MKRMFSFALVIVMISAAVIPTNAATDDQISPYYTYVGSVYANLSLDETLGVATCTGRVTAKSVAPVKVIVYLQMYKNGTWTNLTSWTSTGTTVTSATGKYAVARGYMYRTYVIGYVYNSDGLPVESASVSYSAYLDA